MRNKYEYIPNMESDLGECRPVEGIVYHPTAEAHIYRVLAIERIGVVYEEDDDE